ncbi:MAG: ATP-binding protein [Candidatus Brocadiia bacterium]
MFSRSKSITAFVLLSGLMVMVWVSTLVFTGDFQLGRVLFDGAALAVVVAGLMLIRRLEVRCLTVGWVMLGLALLLDITQQLLSVAGLLNPYLKVVIASGGLALIAYGFYCVFRRIHEKERRYSSLFHEMGEGVALHSIVCDASGMATDYVFEQVNPAFESIAGLPAEEVVGSRASELCETGEAYLLDVYTSVVETGESIEFETYFPPFEKSLRISAFCPAKGTFATVMTDVTDQKRMERQLRETLADLKNTQKQLIDQERQRALNTMASGIAHDFNNALSTISGFTDRLIDNPDKLEDRDKALEYLRLISSAASNAAETVRRMRKFYKPQDDADYAVVDLSSVVQEAVSMTRPRWTQEAQAKGKDISLQTDLDGKAQVLGAESELHEMLTNLIFNAVDAIEGEGHIHVTTHCDESEVVLRVSDNGAGMDAETVKRCTEPFFSTQGVNGRGLGLAVTRGIVGRHEGEMDIDSQPGQGTTVEIRMPLSEGESEEVADTQNDSGAVPPLHFLVVEDESNQRQLIREMLQNVGHDVELADTGADGLEKFNAGDFDMVLTDRAMPEMGGDELAHEIKKQQPDLPIIMVTGFADMMDAAGERPEGVDAVISKPVSFSKLNGTISELWQDGPDNAGAPPHADSD